MTSINFSLGSNTYDNAPIQLTALDFDDFITQISKTGSKRKGQFYICSPLQSGLHDDPSKYSGLNNWRLKRLALPRRFLALDADYFKSPNDFAAFRALVGKWNAMVYTTASHTAQAPRARAIIELDELVDSMMGEDLGDALQRQIEATLGSGNIKLDPSVYLSSQPIYTSLISSQTYRLASTNCEISNWSKDAGEFDSCWNVSSNVCTGFASRESNRNCQGKSGSYASVRRLQLQRVARYIVCTSLDELGLC